MYTFIYFYIVCILRVFATIHVEHFVRQQRAVTAQVFVVCTYNTVEFQNQSCPFFFRGSVVHLDVYFKGVGGGGQDACMRVHVYLKVLRVPGWLRTS